MPGHHFNSSAQYHEGSNKSQYSATDTKEKAEKIADEIAANKATTTKKDVTINEYIGEVLANELDQYDNHTYNLKLYLIAPGTATSQAGTEDGVLQDADTSDSDEQRKDDGGTGSSQFTGSGWLNNNVRDKPENTVVLAQTGVTEVGIDDLSIESVPSGTSGSESAKVKFTITQPLACDFPDQIVRARTYLGMPADAGADVPFFLEINFIGYNESGGTPRVADADQGGKQQNIKGPYVFPIIIKNFSMNITAGGSSYDFEGVVKDDLVNADAFMRLDKWFTITGRTIYEMMYDLETQINNYKEKNKKIERVDFGLKGTKGKVAKANSQPVSDGTVPGLDIQDQSLDIDNAEDVAKIINPKVMGVDVEGPPSEIEEPRTTMVNVVKNAIGFPISIDLKEGMHIEKVLGILLSMNVEFMNSTTRSKSVDADETEVDVNKLVTWYALDVSLEYGEYNEDKAEYSKVGHIIPRTFQTPSSSIAIKPEEVTKGQNLDKEEERTKVNQMHIKKAYEYIFTGRNDQILDLNIQYNEGLALLVPTERGLLGDISLNAASVLNATSVPVNQSAKDGGIDKLNESAKSGGGGFFDQLKKLKDTAESTLDMIGKAANFNNAQLKDLLNNQAGESATKLKNLLADQNNAQAIADALTARKTASAQADVVTQADEFSPGASGFIYGGDLGLQGDVKYADRLEENANNYKDSKTEPAKSPKKSGSPALRYQEKIIDGFANVGTTKGVKNNLFTYLYDQHNSIDFLMRLEMQLRGDPWWLGRMPLVGDINKAPVGMDSAKIKETVEDSDNYLTTTRDNFFLFAMNSPRLIDGNLRDEDANTGLWNQESDGTSYFLSGIYQVRDVTHSFNMGEYKMDIVGVKETAINLDTLGRIDNFRMVDTERTGFSARKQDGVLTDSDKTAAGMVVSDHHAHVTGEMASSGKTAEELKAEGLITQIQYDAWKAKDRDGSSFFKDLETGDD